MEAQWEHLYAEMESWIAMRERRRQRLRQAGQWLKWGSIVALLLAWSTFALGSTVNTGDAITLSSANTWTGLNTFSSTTGIVAQFNEATASQNGAISFRVTNLDKGYLGWNSNDGFNGQGAHMFLYNSAASGKLHLFDASFSGLTVMGGNVGIGDTAPGVKLAVSGNVISTGTIRTTCVTVGALPSTGAGSRTCVSDQLTACPALGGTFTGGGALICSAFHNGTAWVHN